MYGSPAMSKDLNLPFPGSPFRQGKEDSDLRRAQKEQEMSSGFLRYRAASGSAFAEEFAPNRSSSPEEAAAAESMFARFMAREQVGGEKRSEEVAAAPHMFFQTSFQQQIPVSAGESGRSSGLVPRSSSPAGLFSHLNVENGAQEHGRIGNGTLRLDFYLCCFLCIVAGFSGIRSMGGFQSAVGGTSDAETGKRLKGQISFSSRQGSVGPSQISEIGNEDVDGTNRDKNPTAASAGARCYVPGFPVASWEDSVLMSESFAGEKAVRDPSESQNMEMRNHPTFAHHYSLPKSSPEMVAMERFLQFQDAVPCKIRAKRGCATHPRSIAERVRRTRISERMRKLQELVPNMDKQTNTADMLDLAVDYIKDLHRQAKMLQDNRANCSCSHKQTNNS